MSLPIFSIRLPYKMRCNLPDCRKPVQLIFRKTIDGNPLNFCSTPHANIGEERWDEKKRLNVRMDVPPKDTQSEMVGDNIQELDNE